jgi:hypothetical protein
MYNTAKWGSAAVVAHTVISGCHGLAHLQVGVPIFPTAFHFVCIVGVITLAPITSMLLLWTSWRRAGAWLLLVSLAGSLLFGGYYHYLAPGPDHCSQIPNGGWGILFHATAALLIVTEVWGCGIAARALFECGRVRSGPESCSVQ